MSARPISLALVSYSCPPVMPALRIITRRAQLRSQRYEALFPEALEKS